MKKWSVLGIAGLLAVAVLAWGFTSEAYAQADTPETAAQAEWFGREPGFGRGMQDQVSLQAAADALGMTVDELTTQLWGGKTLADLAEEKGVALEDVKAAVDAAQQQALRDRIAQAVADGNITQAHADWLLEGIEQGFINGFRDRFGMGGMRGFHGGGFEGLPGGAPASSSTDS